MSMGNWLTLPIGSHCESTFVAFVLQRWNSFRQTCGDRPGMESA
jgi:hypothetical protein